MCLLWLWFCCIGTADANQLLRIRAEPQFGGCEEAIHDVIMVAHTVIDEFAAAVRADDEQRRRLALVDAARKLDVHVSAVVEGTGFQAGSSPVIA